MIKLTRTPAEDVWYDFEDEVCLWNDEDNIVIAGNDDFREFGDKTLLAIIENKYYDEDTDENGETIGYDYDTYEELEKVTGKKWDSQTMTGYSQSDWQYIYYVVDEVSQDRINEIGDFYFGKVDEFMLEDGEDRYTVYVPHRVSWDGKKAICDYLDLKPEETTILIDNGYHRVYDYEEME